MEDQGCKEGEPTWSPTRLCNALRPFRSALVMERRGRVDPVKLLGPHRAHQIRQRGGAGTLSAVRSRKPSGPDRLTLNPHQRKENEMFDKMIPLRRCERAGACCQRLLRSSDTLVRCRRARPSRLRPSPRKVAPTPTPVATTPTPTPVRANQNPFHNDDDDDER